MGASIQRLPIQTPTARSHATPLARGQLVALKPLAELTADQIVKLRLQAGLDPAKLPPVTNGITFYRVSYGTVDLQGKPTLASGLVLAPKGLNGPAEMLAYMHGTTAGKDAGPSGNLKASQTIMAAAVYAGSGYMTAMPDYLGFGDAAEPDPAKWADPAMVSVPGANQQRIMHPYLHMDTEASASADMLIACQEASKQLGVAMTGKLFLNGYSQGGHATMATHRLLETDPELQKRFKVTASVPIAGPHDVFKTAERIWHTPNPRFGAATLAYGLLARDHRIPLGQTVDSFLAEPYAKAAWKNFSNDPPAGKEEFPWTQGFENVRPRDMLTPAADKQLFDGDTLRPDSDYAKGMVANSPHLGFTTQTPILLVSPANDDTVPWDIDGVGVLRTMSDAGCANVRLLMVPGDHLTGARAAFTGAVTFMEQFRKKN